MPLDPQAEAVLVEARAIGLPPTHTLTPAEARRQMESRPSAAGEPIRSVEDRTAPGPAAEIPVRIYTPAGAGPFGVLVFFHGGGWVLGSIAGTDATCRALANRAGCVVVSVDYRLAPEHKFPAAADDAYAATCWVVDTATMLGGDPSRVAVGGLSAGGNLAAVVALMAKERGYPGLAFQLLCYPITDYVFDTPSYRDNAEGYQLTRDSMIWFWGHYLPERGDGFHPHASPLRAEDLRGLPPAHMITAEYDPLRDEGEAYARRLRDAGVTVTCTRYDGMMHGFMGMAAVLEKGRLAVEEAAGALGSALASTPADAAAD